MIRVLIADDHAIVRRGLRQILLETGEIDVAAEASNGREVLDLLSKPICDLVMLDISMPGENGLDVLKRIRQSYPRLPVLVVSMHPEEQYAVRILRAGASGYITKDASPDALVEAVRKAASGRKVVSPSLAESLAADLEYDRTKPIHQSLSNREYQVFRLIASGKPVHAIAESMHLSVKTVSTYRARILEKTGLKNNAELMHYALTEKLVE